ncbi:hypothetical protein D3C72_2415020 [compost metagenome]
MWQHLGKSRNIAAGENMFADKRIGSAGAIRAADCMKQENAVFFQQACRVLEIFSEVSNAHMLKHAN